MKTLFISFCAIQVYSRKTFGSSYELEYVTFPDKNKWFIMFSHLKLRLIFVPNSWPLYQLHLPAPTKIFFLQISARMDSHHWDLCSPSGRVIPDHPTCSDGGRTDFSFILWGSVAGDHKRQNKRRKCMYILFDVNIFTWHRGLHRKKWESQSS